MITKIIITFFIIIALTSSSSSCCCYCYAFSSTSSFNKNKNIRTTTSSSIIAQLQQQQQQKRPCRDHHHYFHSTRTTSSSSSRLYLKNPNKQQEESDDNNNNMNGWQQLFVSSSSSSSSSKEDVVVVDEMDSEKFMLNNNEEEEGFLMTTIDNDDDRNKVIGLVTALTAITVIGTITLFDLSPSDISNGLNYLTHNPGIFLDNIVLTINDMGTIQGLLCFGFFYTIAEILAIPATPLTLSAGYLFGITQGTLIVLISASIAASISFVIGKTILRQFFVNNVIAKNPKFIQIDTIIAKEGFKLMFLLRLSPLFPFALSNYIYGASSINFTSYFWGTLLGFAPGTFAYVYTGMVGKALTTTATDTSTTAIDATATAQPWYIYAFGFIMIGGFLKLIADLAANVIEELGEEQEQQEQLQSSNNNGNNIIGTTTTIQSPPPINNNNILQQQQQQQEQEETKSFKLW